VSLTAVQKVAGNHFRASQLIRITHELPPADAKCTPFIREYRHDCSSRGGVSWPLRLKEKTELSPEYRVCACSQVGPFSPDFPHMDCGANKQVTPEGFFAYTWLEGACTCGLEVRSGTGRLEIRG